MSTAQYKVFGFVCVLLGVALGITHLAMTDGAARGTSEPPPVWAGPGAIAFFVLAVWLFFKKSPDPQQMNDVELLQHNMRQTRNTQMILVLIVFVPLGALAFGLTFLGWDSSSDLGLGGVIFMAFLFATAVMLGLASLRIIYHTIGGRGRAAIDRLLMRPGEISHIEWMTTTVNGASVSRHGSVHIHFTDGTFHHFQGDPLHAERIVRCLQERRPDLPVNPGK